MNRNAVAPIYGVLVVVAFIISVKVGIIVAIVGGPLVGFYYAGFFGGRPKGGRERNRRRDRP